MRRDYAFEVYDFASLGFLGDVARRVASAKWTRRFLDHGSFEFAVPRVGVDPALIDEYRLIRIRRDGRHEMWGMIEHRTLDELGDRWIVGGRDLLGFWITTRHVGLTTPVQKDGAAETIAKAYVEDNLGPTADAARRATADLASGTTWTVQATGGLGIALDYSAQRRGLFQVTRDILRASDLLHEVVALDDLSGYEYRVREPVNATQGAGAGAFAVAFRNVGELGYREDFRNIANVLYVAGEGAGGTRDVSELAATTFYPNAPGAFTRVRREGVEDARYATNSDQREMAGRVAFAQQIAAAISGRVQPLDSSEYRVRWDAGYDVTIAFAQAGVSIDRRIAGVTVSFDDRGEEIRIELGEQRPDSTLRKIQDAIEALRVSSVE